MSETKTKINPEKVLKEDFMKPNGEEMVITPRNQFLEWFKYVKGIVGKMDVKINDVVDWMKCPKCQTAMENYTLNNDPDELWYLCPNCNLKFSKQEYQNFTSMIMRLINGDFASEK
jgi:hypothetical protein